MSERKEKQPEEMSQEELQVVALKFNDQQRQSQQMRRKIAELDQDLQDHILVLQNLEPLAEDRKCYRLIGGVLVERTVGEVRPKIEANKENLLGFLNKMAEQLKVIEDEVRMTKIKYAAFIEDQTPKRAAASLSSNQQGQQGVLA
jgi:prefoldin subunit 2